MEISSKNILQGITQILKEEGFIKGVPGRDGKIHEPPSLGHSNRPGNRYAIKGIRTDEPAGRRLYVGRTK